MIGRFRLAALIRCLGDLLALSPLDRGTFGDLDRLQRMADKDAESQSPLSRGTFADHRRRQRAAGPRRVSIPFESGHLRRRSTVVITSGNNMARLNPL